MFSIFVGGAGMALKISSRTAKDKKARKELQRLLGEVSRRSVGR